MTKLLNPLKWLTCFLMLSMSFACRKENLCNRNYTYYTPIFERRDQAYADITSNNQPRNIVRPGKIVISGSRIFLNDYGRGIHIIDNSDPRHPVQTAFIKLAGNTDLAVRGSILYADFLTDLLAIDISDIHHVKVLDSVAYTLPWRWDMTYNYTAMTSSAGIYRMTDSTKVVVDWIRKDTTMNCDIINYPGGIYMAANPQSSAAIGSNASVAGSMASFAITGSYLYMLSGSQLKSFSLDQPQHPVPGSVVAEFNTLETIFPFNNKLFVGSPNGVYIYSLSDPGQPSREGVFGHARVCDPVITDGKYAYSTLRSGSSCGGYTNQLDILDVTNITTPKLVRSYQMHNPKGLAKDDNLLFICDESEGLKVYELRDDGKAIFPTDRVSGIDAYDIIVQDHLAIVSTTNGLYQYDYTNRYQMKFLSKVQWNKQ